MRRKEKKNNNSHTMNASGELGALITSDSLQKNCDNIIESCGEIIRLRLNGDEDGI